MGSTLAFVLAGLLVIGLIVTATVWSATASLRAIGEKSSRVESRRALESEFERARAILLETGDLAELTAAGFQAEWRDTCHLSIGITLGEVTTAETWSAIIPTRFAIYSDSVVILSDESVIEGPIFQGCLEDCDTVVIDTAPLYALAHRRLVADRIENLSVAFEILIIEPVDTAVRIENLRIDNGTLIVEGDLILAGEFEGTTSEGMPLVVVLGALGSEVHEAPWAWTGHIAATRDVFLSDPIDYEGGIISNRTVELFGSVGEQGSHEAKIIQGISFQMKRFSR